MSKRNTVVVNASDTAFIGTESRDNNPLRHLHGNPFSQSAAERRRAYVYAEGISTPPTVAHVTRGSATGTLRRYCYLRRALPFIFLGVTLGELGYLGDNLIEGQL